MIIASAVQLSNNKVYIGKRHNNCYDQIKALGIPKKKALDATQGFLTDNLEFLNREEGYYHAYKCNQCDKQVPHESNYALGLYIKKEEWKAFLMSEDLW